MKEAVTNNITLCAVVYRCAPFCVALTRGAPLARAQFEAEYKTKAGCASLAIRCGMARRLLLPAQALPPPTPLANSFHFL